VAAGEAIDAARTGAIVQEPDETSTAPAYNQHIDTTPPLLFIVIMMTYDRPQGHNLTQFGLSIDSILRQSNPHWELHITGDDYPADKVPSLYPVLSRVPPAKLHWANLNAPGERGRWPGMTDVWRCAGAAAGNAGLERVEMAYNPTRANMAPVIITHLDDDDSWAPNHLDVLARTYAAFPEAVFVYTQSLFRKAPFPAYAGPVSYNNYPPRESHLIHNSASWRLADFFGWRYRTCNTTKMPVDADMWNRMARHMETRALKSVLNPQVTTYHLTERGVEQ